MTSSTALKQFFSAGRPLIEQALDLAEQIAALRDAATQQGLDWSQIKALLKAQIQDERDGSHKRVTKLVEKAEFACAYADMLGLGNVNEKNISAEVPHDASTGEILADHPPVANHPYLDEPLAASSPGPAPAQAAPVSLDPPSEDDATGNGASAGAADNSDAAPEPSGADQGGETGSPAAAPPAIVTVTQEFPPYADAAGPNHIAGAGTMVSDNLYLPPFLDRKKIREAA